MRNVLCVVVGLLAGLASTSSFAQTQYPLKIENCGYEHTYFEPPKAVVSIGQDVTETLYQLGVWDKIVGTSVWLNDVVPQFSQIDKIVPRLSDDIPTLESILQKKPDFIGSQFEWYVGESGVIGSRELFASHGIAAYVLPTDCANHDNAVGMNGAQVYMFNTESLYKGIEDLSNIFDKQERGAMFIAELKEREANAIARAKKDELNNVSAVFWYSSPNLDGPAYVAGRTSPAGYILNALEIDNIVHSDEEWPLMDWISISRANPSVIVLAKMNRRRWEADDYKTKIAFLKRHPYTRNMTAVKENRFVIMDALAMRASTRLFDGLEQMSIALDAVKGRLRGGEK
ncbi:Periplasmic binding protein [Marinomonas spartinae]|uniref:ABC transporter substrate-binding protein n=1 Tax=Marinomonas spartinae TaxID=1792290 RepID=UPI000808E57C|nr:ABC transporter substrate-binding protein [Marinomonas spartinae]SBS32957.1 Periplasmic binding protein [Marinomonas spartinae]